jgi:hypothetical protein
MIGRGSADAGTLGAKAMRSGNKTKGWADMEWEEYRCSKTIKWYLGLTSALDEVCKIIRLNREMGNETHASLEGIDLPLDCVEALAQMVREGLGERGLKVQASSEEAKKGEYRICIDAELDDMAC